MVTNTKGEELYVSLADYVKEQRSSKLIPDLDLDQVKLNRKLQLAEFIKMYSALVEEVEFKQPQLGPK